jgi:hypothetical protein
MLSLTGNIGNLRLKSLEKTPIVCVENDSEYIPITGCFRLESFGINWLAMLTIRIEYKE